MIAFNKSITMTPISSGNKAKQKNFFKYQVPLFEAESGIWAGLAFSWNPYSSILASLQGHSIHPQPLKCISIPESPDTFHKVRGTRKTFETSPETPTTGEKLCPQISTSGPNQTPVCPLLNILIQFSLNLVHNDQNSTLRHPWHSPKIPPHTE